MGGKHVVEVTKSSWQTEVLDSKTPVLADFWAEWCGPCRAIAPVLSQLADELDGKLKVAKVNVDEDSELASQFGIRSIPTLILFKDGEVKESFVGAMSKAALQGKIQPYL